MAAERLFRAAFAGESWDAWKAFLAALFGLPLNDEQGAIWRACTGRQDAPAAPFAEAWLICGRRSGKSRILALIAVYLACFREWHEQLAPGEHATIPVLAADRRQARTIMRYVRALLHDVPALKVRIEHETAAEIRLAGRVAIEVGTASFRTLRGYTLAAALCDEIAFWRSEESANPDREILDALRPAMATVDGAMLLCASSPYARRGVLWQAYRRYWGRDDARVLVWKADTRTMNPTVPARVVDEAAARDPAAAAAEYAAEFRTELETFAARAAIEACTVAGRFELPPQRGLRYYAFVDPSGGSADAMTMAIAHMEGERAVLDALREVRPPFSPERAVADFAALMHRYRIDRAAGDRYAGEWPREQFAKQGIRYEPAERTKSELYRDLLPLLNSGRLELLDVPLLASQLAGLERRVGRGGRDSIDHPPGGHDDLVNAAAGALLAGKAAAGRGFDPAEMRKMMR
ncbi:MAG: hypothetical protein JO047_05870 [Alphaproteobacteria bacterium]|nr:hypothetical protein [Alphaproteobacteria bacterium]